MSRRKPRVRPTREETRERVMAGAGAVFARRGFDGASIDEICRESDLTRGAFYSSFESKEDLFFALYDRMVREVEARFAVMIGGITPEHHDVTAIVTDIVGRYPVDREWFLLFSEFNLYALRNPAVAATLAQHRSRMLAAIGGVVDAVFATNGVTTPIETTKIARLFLAMHEGNFSQSEIEPDQIGHGELFQTFCPIIVAGLVARLE